MTILWIVMAAAFAVFILPLVVPLHRQHKEAQRRIAAQIVIERAFDDAIKSFKRFSEEASQSLEPIIKAAKEFLDAIEPRRP